MKKIFLFIIVLVLMFTALGCSNDNNAGTELDPKEEAPIEDNEKTYEFININIEDLYFVGEESDITISIYPERKIDSISYKSNNEEIITIDNNGHLKALKEGKVLITITIDGKEEKRIVEVEEDEVVSALNEYSDNTTSEDSAGTSAVEWYKMYQKYLAREEEAKEHGFSSYKEYRAYLSEIKKQERLNNINEKFEETCRIAESLGLTWEDYICLQIYKTTYDEINENAKKYGYSFVFEETKANVYGRQLGYEIVDYKLYRRFRIIMDIIDGTIWLVDTDQESLYGLHLGHHPDGTRYYQASEYYFNIVFFNNYGYEIDSTMWGPIEELLPKIDYFLEAYDYLIEIVPDEELLSEERIKMYDWTANPRLISRYNLITGFVEQKALEKIVYIGNTDVELYEGFTEEEFNVLDNYFKIYEENNNRN